ncbi:multidrug efflux SMR transporter [Persicobacter sp. CCB-QB2]|uniref:DMT family transporter n=1 Tax=Persicobacter sp. CCB-QB2 TaxID=1561025 RepID=UPI00155D932B|nr:multidrug efflux SMR transporter [Persicobacter sp. CCB-QB2]
MMRWIFLTISIISEVIGTSAMNASEGFTKPLPSIITAVGYGVAFYFLSMTLKEINVSVAYAIWSGAGIVLLAIIGYFWLGQQLDLASIIGIGFIIAGVIIINVFSNSVSH